MGYEINYSPEDYVQAAQACRAVASLAGQAQLLLGHCLMHAVACRVEAGVRANAAGLAAWLPRVSELADQLQALGTRATGHEDEARELAARLDAARQNAEETERKIRALISLLSTPTTVLDGYRGARENDWRPPRDDTQRLLELVAVWANLELLPWQGTDPDGSPIQDVMRRLSRQLDTHNLLRREPITIEQVQQLAPLRLDGTLDSYYQLLDLTRQEESRILIGRTHNDGREVFVVIVPGTQPPQADGNAFDPRGIVDSLGHDSNNYGEAFARALELSGAREGSEIILTGHSQGGIHIANLARHPMLRNKFKVKTVLTLGSPIGPIKLPEDVMSLHLEDGTDPVPGMDGMPNRREKKQVTVTFPRPVNPDSLDSDGFGRGHQLENYREHLKYLQEHPNTETDPIIRSLMFAPGPMLLKGFRLRRREKQVPAPNKKDRNYRKLSEVSPPH